ncbi:GNAT family N-acetyltransferase [Lacticaseibacillus rhamnosus]|uniref:GNAT family N-acetyltransferase n=1 Tax=Lacticaseibacillus rhamnosus TaxID=47715 RepID=UPI0008A3F774|nr:GNAT family N-acetyltransferase [Lacticaseibacillus rhamnosus]MDK7183544.1 GNAT family N-acetyltransferase [Lacticaseibacillus rhamnosus]MDK7240812.1 GNAT family N-acetyltransferase [Lacticaseibacillus rhamnosus]MDT8865529.1 GNAT family N-acetyltransferase [Lacticaseibacillus rhamnosus]OFN11556.1 GNAT family acetyltransferase [Lactobacillus sp. HMSC072E07]
MVMIQIQKATFKSDFNAVRRVYYVTWQVAYRDLIPASFLKQLSPASWHPERRWQDTFLAIDDIAGIVGVCSYGPARMAERAGWGELYSIYVLPAFQRQHVGERLLNAALKELDGAYSNDYVRVLDNNHAAQAFYRRFGFTETKTVLEDSTKFGTIRELVMVRKPAQ